jgi:uncharacterized protein
MAETPLDQEQIITATRNWVQNLVVDLNLCPFARRELNSGGLQFVVSTAITKEQLLQDLYTQLERMKNDVTIETLLIIHLQVLEDFYEYNQFLDNCDALLVDLKLEGVFQLASFHPDYQFAESDPADAGNFTNKSPFPMLHLLREDSLQSVIELYGDTHEIYQRNTRLLTQMGTTQLQALLAACYRS